MEKQLGDRKTRKKKERERYESIEVKKIKKIEEKDKKRREIMIVKLGNKKQKWELMKKKKNLKDRIEKIIENLTWKKIETRRNGKEKGGKREKNMGKKRKNKDREKIIEMEKRSAKRWKKHQEKKL